MLEADTDTDTESLFYVEYRKHKRYGLKSLYFDITIVKTKKEKNWTKGKTDQKENRTKWDTQHKTAQGTQVNKHDIERIKHVKLQKQTRINKTEKNMHG
jgi:hypothetical protein